jgi:hypothetical protein
MWVWTYSSPAEVVRFAKTHHVSDVFVYVHPDRVSSSTALAAALTKAGLHPYALGGDPSWVTRPAVATRWAADVLATGVYQGIHLDVEPHMLANFSQQTQRYLTNLVTVVSSVNKIHPCGHFASMVVSYAV